MFLMINMILENVMFASFPFPGRDDTLPGYPIKKPGRTHDRALLNINMLIMLGHTSVVYAYYFLYNFWVQLPCFLAHTRYIPIQPVYQIVFLIVYVAALKAFFILFSLIQFTCYLHKSYAFIFDGLRYQSATKNPEKFPGLRYKLNCDLIYPTA